MSSELQFVPIYILDEKELSNNVSRGTVGTSLPGSVIKYIEGKPALPVVAKKTAEPPRSLKLYVMTDKDPRSGLCNPFQLNLESVLFFSEYRTSARNLPDRRKEWVQKGLEFSVSSSSEMK